MELFTNWHTWHDAEPELRRLLPAPDADAVARAVEFAVRRHGDQTRPTGAPYAEHLLEALEVLVRGVGVTDPEILQAAVLHDVVEDTPCTLEEVRRTFGGRVAELVGWVTKPEPAEGADRTAAKEAYLRRLRDAPEDAVVVKLADRVSNVQTLRNLGLPKQRQYYAETVRFIMPLAARREWWADWYSAWQRAHQDLA
ncbi:MAG TPA: HD domain-containing protein [Trebonia sp.]|jgi:GTP pyrophosphokinase|nr:HD domain-containing protein [Trebonia sp.]